MARKINDKLMENKKAGRYYTPGCISKLMHDLTCREFGPNWKDEYIVWDCAWGTGNLTRGYKFKELYGSTLEQFELDEAEKLNTNPEATKFRFDFLNYTLNDLPVKLKDRLLKGCKIIFYINPPYLGSQGVNGLMNGNESGNHNETDNVRKRMRQDGCGKSSGEMYVRFFYRIMLIAQLFPQCEVNIVAVCKNRYMCSCNNESFRKSFLKQFHHVRGVMFRGSLFENVSDFSLSIDFWRAGEQKDKKHFKTAFLDYDKESHKWSKLKDLVIYNTDGEMRITEYRTIPLKREKGEMGPFTGSGFRCKGLKRLINGQIAGLTGHTDLQNQISQWFISNPSAMGETTPITMDNLRESLLCFALMKSRTDEHIMYDGVSTRVPDLNHPKFKQLNDDAVIAALFDGANITTSMVYMWEGVEYDVRNPFFWLTQEEMRRLCADEGVNIKTSGEDPILSTIIPNLTLSKVAQDVLQSANQILRESLKYRRQIDAEHPELMVQRWDAGWIQVRRMVKMIPELRELIDHHEQLQKKLMEHIRNLAVETGSLI